MNRIEAALEGRVTKSPELKTAQSGTEWCSLSPAVGRDDEDGGTTFVQVSVFGEDAKVAAQLPKGTRVYVEGTLRLSRWTAADGSDRHGIHIAANTMMPIAQIGRRRKAIIRRPPARPSTEHLSQTYHRPLPPRSEQRLNDPLPF